MTGALLISAGLCTAFSSSGAGASGAATNDNHLAIVVDTSEPPPIPEGELQLGVDNGYYASHGLDVSAIAIPTDSVGSAMIAGEANIADLGIATFVELTDKGLKLTIVNSVDEAPDYIVVARNGINTLHQLIGKTFIGGPSGAQENYMFDYMLTETHIAVTKVKAVDVGGTPADRLLAVIHNEGQASVIPEAQWLSLSPSERAGVHLMYDQRQFVEKVPFQAKVDAALTSFVKQHPQTIQKFVTASIGLAKYFKQNPREWAIETVDFHPGLKVSALENLAKTPGFAAEWCVTGCLTTRALQITENLLVKYGVIPKTTKPVRMNSAVVDKSFVEEALKK